MMIEAKQNVRASNDGTNDNGASCSQRSSRRGRGRNIQQRVHPLRRVRLDSRTSAGHCRPRHCQCVAASLQG